MLPIENNQSFCHPLLKQLIVKPETLMHTVMNAIKKFRSNGLNLYQWEWLRHIAAFDGKVQPCEKKCCNNSFKTTGIDTFIILLLYIALITYLFINK